MLYPLPEWIAFANIRHAHSHLMFFNWITPPIMAWMMVRVVGKSDNRSIRQFSACLYTMIGLGFLSWPFFLLYGYHPVSVGAVSLPIGAFVTNRLEQSKKFFVITVLLVLVSLAMISGYWPPALLPSDIYRWVMIGAMLPVIPAIWFWVDGFQIRKGN